MKEEIRLKPIGIIHTPYTEPKGMPIQGKFEKAVTGQAELFVEYQIGISIVKLEKLEKNVITFSEVDILDKTPLLDIKPYVSHFDSRENVKNGWLDKHFESGEIPKRTKIE